MEPTNKPDELKRIFFFLAGKEESEENQKLSIEDIIYGLDHYGLKMDQTKKDDLKNALVNKRDNDGNIDFDDFKDCFDLKKKEKHKKTEEIQNTAKQLFFLIQEILGFDEVQDKLSKDNIKDIFRILFGLDEVDKNQINLDNVNKNFMRKKTKIDKIQLQNKTNNSNNNYSMISKAFQRNNKLTPNPGDEEEEKFVRELKNEFNNPKKDFGKTLVDCIDLDGDELISISDFEFLIKMYLGAN